MAVMAYTEHPGGTISIDETWLAGTHYVTGTITVDNGVRLTVMPGAMVKFAPHAQMTVYGTLRAGENQASEVVFTSRDDDAYGKVVAGSDGSPAPGDWDGIYLNGLSAADGIGNFDYCRIRCGGNPSGSADANVFFNYSDSGYFKNSVSEFSEVHGIRISGCSPEIINSTFSNSASHGLSVLSGLPTVTNCIFWGDAAGEIAGSPSIIYSDVQGGYAGVGNIDKDPLFFDPEIGDCHLDLCSPAIDAGDPVEVLTADYIPGGAVYRRGPGDAHCSGRHGVDYGREQYRKR
jgi:hypothetical protein